MADPIKVHAGLADVHRGQVYHLGYYAADLQDGELQFKLFAQICPEQDCPCDNIRIDWETGDTVYRSWLTQDGGWKDIQHQPVPEEMEAVFRIVADTENFRERFGHLLYLRHKQVLKETGRLEGPFEVRIPENLLLPGADLANGSLGCYSEEKKKRRRKTWPFSLEFCGDPSCFCESLFLALGDGASIFTIERDDRWTPVGDNPADARLMTRVRTKLIKSPRFGELLQFLRGERLLHNYFRHVTQKRKTLSALTD